MPRSVSRFMPWLALATAVSAPAQALVLSEDELEESSTEIGIVARAFSFSLLGEPLDDPIGIGLFDLRIYFKTQMPRWKLVVTDQLTTSIRSQNLLGLGVVGRGLPPPRLLPLQHDIVDDPTFAIRHQVDWVYAAWTADRFTITVGRQPVTFGRGKLWRPYDLVSMFALTEVDTEYKPGADAIRFDWSPTERSNVSLVVVSGELEDDGDLRASKQGTAVVARAKLSAGGGELGGFGGYVRGDAVAGVDGVYDTGHFDVYAETTVTRASGDSLSSPRVAAGDYAAKATIGATFRPLSKVTVGTEAMYNGFGATRRSDYVGVALSERSAVGEQIFFGQWYGGVTASWQAHPLLTAFASALANLRDPSALASAGLNYSIADNAVAVLGGYAPIGEDGTEYGSIPYFLFFELKAVL